MNRYLPWLLLLTGCATFKTDQVDRSTLATYEAGRIVSVEVREIRSRAKARTFFEGSTSLQGFKAVQTDKTQSSSIGELSQQASATNLVKVAEAAAQGAVNLLLKKGL